MSVGRVMDWLEARLDAIGGRDDDDQEEDDRVTVAPKPFRPARQSSSEPHRARQTKSPTPTPTAAPSQVDSTRTERRPSRSLTPPSQSPNHSPAQQAQPLPLSRRSKSQSQLHCVPRARSKDPLGFSSLTNSNAHNIPFTFSFPDAVGDASEASPFPTFVIYSPPQIASLICCPKIGSYFNPSTAYSTVMTCR